MRVLGALLFAASVHLPAFAADLSVDLGEAHRFDERFSSEMARIGFDQRPAAARPVCTTAGGKVSCNMRVGSSMAVLIGTDASGKMVHDLTLVKVGGDESVSWINAMTTLMALFEPEASSTSIRDALKALSSPMAAGKTEFSTKYDMPSTHLTMNAHPLMGIVLTLGPR